MSKHEHVGSIPCSSTALPSLNGLAATAIIARDHPSTRALMLTTFDLDEYVLEAIRAGASRFVLKDVPP